MAILELDFMEYADNAAARAAYAMMGAEHGGVAESGDDGAGGPYTFVNEGYPITKAGTIYSVDYFSNTASSDMTIRVFRINGSNYEMVGQSETFQTLTGGVTRTLTTPITGVESGDFLGCYLATTCNNMYDTSDGNGCHYKNADVTTPTAISSFTDDVDGILQLSCIVTSLEDYSESTIKEQGSYSLKAIAVQTDSLNDTLTRTVGPVIDLSGLNTIKFDIRASRTGSNIRVLFRQTSDAYTKILLHGRGLDESQTIIDEIGKTITAVGDVKIDSAQAKFLSTSIYFDGAGDYLTIPNSSDFDLGTGDFTLDLWVYPTDFTGYNGLIGAGYQGVGEAWTLYTNVDGVVRFTNTGATSDLVTSSNLSLTINQWNHIAVIRKGTGATDLNIYIGGVAGNAPASGNITLDDVNQGIAIGKFRQNDALHYFTGWMDEVRISKGIARWSVNFTPDTTPYDLITSSPTVSSADTWKEKEIDISSIANGDKDSIDRIIFEIINSAAANTFYIDNMYAQSGLSPSTQIIIIS